MGDVHRHKANAPRPNRKPGQLAPLPESQAPYWGPTELPGKRFLVLSDLHVPHHCVRSIEAALAYGDDYGPDSILINGDLFDFYQISRFDKNPTLPKVYAELLAGGDFLDHVRQRFQRAKIYFKLGNHDERWTKYLHQNAPLLAEVPEVSESWKIPSGIIRNRVTVIDNQQPVMLGRLMVLHGHEAGKGGGSSVNPARGSFMKHLTCVLSGHLHKQSEHTEATSDGRVIACWSTGCLCHMHPEYARLNKWSSGFATVDVKRSGDYKVQLHRIIDGKIF